MAPSRPTRPPRLVRRVASLLLRGPDVSHVRHDIEASFERDLGRGIGIRRARRRYRRNVLGSVASVWCARLRLPRPPSISWLDLRLGYRMLVKHPALTLIGGLGIAIATAIAVGSFAFFDAFVYSELPFEDGHRIVGIENWDTERNNEERRALADFLRWRDELQTVEEVGAFRTVSHNLIGGDGPSQSVEVAEITASGFRLTRVAPLRGRTLLDADERVAGESVLVIGHDEWQRRFGGDPSIVGSTVQLGAERFTVVGIMPEGFAFPRNHSYWTALRVDPATVEPVAGPSVFVFGRLVTGVSIDEAGAEVAALGQRSAVMWPETHTRLRPQVLPYAYPLLDINEGGIETFVAAVGAMLTLLLVVVSVNVAILVYARTATRQPEIAVRSALGASRGRVVAQLFIEALLLVAVSGCVGVVLAGFGLRQGFALMETEAAIPFWIDASISIRVLAYVIGLALLAAAIIGVIPALQATGARFRSGVGRISAGTTVRLGRTWTLLIVCQVAVAVALLPMALSAGWSEIRNLGALPAFEADAYVALRIRPTSSGTEGADDPAGALARFEPLADETLRRIATEPWLAAMTIADDLPGSGSRARIELEDADGTGARRADARTVTVEPGYFVAFGVPVLAGRAFAAAEVQEAARAVVVNRAFAELVLGASPALGRRVRYPTDDSAAEPGWYEIVGVVADMERNRLAPETVAPLIYHGAPAPELRSGIRFLRVDDAPPDAAVYARIREIASGVDPTTRVSMLPLQEMYRQQQLAMRLMALVLGSLTASVLLLSAGGIYALMSFAVTRRRREIGIRAALGAQRRLILRSIFARATAQVGAGIVVGAAVTALLEPLSGGELLGDAGLLVVPGVAAIMGTAALLAALGPARRGLAIEPTEALREE